MPTTAKVLAQGAPPAATLTTLYTVAAGTTTVVSTLVATNRGTTSTKIQVAVRVNGAALDVKQYIVYDLSIPGSNGHVMTVGMTLGAGDIVSAYSLSGNVSFNMFGEETS